MSNAAILAKLVQQGSPLADNVVSASEVDGLSQVGITGNYDDLLNIPTNPEFVEITVDSLQFNTDSAVVPQHGQLSYNEAFGTLEVGLNNDTQLQLGQETMFYAKATESILKGQVCMFAGAVGGNLQIKKATFNDPNFEDKYLVGLAAQDLLVGEFGYIISFGRIRKLNTSMWNEGDILYIDPDNPGGITNVVPLGQQHPTAIAAVVRKQSQNGEILVRVVFGDHLDTLHDVNLATPLLDGQVLAWSDDLGHWTNIAQTSGGTNDYNQLINKPTIPSIDGLATETYVDDAIAAIPPTDLTGLATETYVDNSVANLVGSAPETLDTLNELANALGTDPNFATTVSNQIGLKANSADLATVATSGDYVDLTNKPTLFDGAYTSLTGTPALFSGDYGDLANKPELATVATSGDYGDLINQPVIPTVPATLKANITIYPGDDLAADPAGGQQITIYGTGFEQTPTVLIDNQIVPSVSFVSSTQINITTPTKTSGTYHLYIVNPDGNTCIYINGISYSGVPSWNTAAGSLGTFDESFSIQLQATSDTTISYSLESGSILPSGVSLSSTGLLSGTVSIDQTFSFTVLATDLENQDTSRSFQVTVASADIYFKYNTLLLNADTAVSPFNSDFSTNSFNVAINGDVKPNRFNPYQEGYYGNYFDGAGDYLLPQPSADLNVGTGPFTIEAWINLNTIDTNYKAIYTFGPGQYQGFYEYNGTLEFWGSAGSALLTFGTISAKTWTHVAATRDDFNNLRLYVNGIASTSVTYTGDLNDNAPRIGVNKQATPAEFFSGHISNLRLVKGSAIYAGNFSPPTAPLTAIAGTQLLTCQSNRFIDNSTNNFTITRTGDVAVSSNQPFTLPSSVEDYGAGYFDGIGDYLYAGSNAAFQMGTGDFTYECFVYHSSISGQQTYFSDAFGDQAGMYFYKNTSHYPGVYYSSQIATSSVALAAGQWYHLAVTRSSGTLRIFVNGVQTASVSDSTNLTQQTQYIAGDNGGSNFLNGYMSNARIVKGTAVYTADFTPPSAPLTAIANTQLLTLQTNGAANNNGFIDSSPNNFLITRNGNTTQGSFSPYGDNWSNYFDGTGDWLETTSAIPAIGTDSFTLELWCYPTSTTSYRYFLAIGPDTHFATGLNVNTYNPYLYSGTFNIISSIPTIPNAWNHVAYVRNGTTLTVYVNGVSGGSVTYTNNLASYTATIATEATKTGYYFVGMLSNIRLVSGTAVYTTNFTPPTAPLTAIAGTSLLTCQSNRFKDSSANNFTVTRNGDTSVQRFSPFAPTAEYDASVIGGSGYFDGTGDYLSTPATGQFTASGNFTVSCWFYLNSFAASYYVVGGNWSATTSDEWLIQVQNNGAIRFLTSDGTAFSSAGVVKLNEWTFFSATRTGTTVTVQVNGLTVSTYTKSDTLGAANKAITIGCQPGGSWPWNGYIADFRLVSGSAVSSIPTTPLTAISGTGLLLSMTNAGIYDNAMMNDLETVGNAQISTSVKKYGTGSIYLDGNGDYLSTPDNPSLQLGTGDFTIECWVYPLSVNGANANPLINKLNGGSNAGWLLGMSSTSLWQFSTGSNVIVRSGAVSLNTWTHLAAVRSAGTTTLYVNGTSVGSTATAFNFTDTVPLRIGWESSFVYCNAYVDDLRITKGVARYTSNFTPPTAAFPNQ